MSTLDNSRKAAKRWLRALRAGDRDAIERSRRAYPGAPANPVLRDGQHALARERGHASWAALKASLAKASSPDPALQALLHAAGTGDVGTLVTILQARPDLVNQRGELPGNTGARTALHFGVGHEPIVRALVERGADPNIRDEGDDAMPLHFAAERGDLAVVTLLVEHGADPIGGETHHLLDAVGWAVCFDYANHTEVARYLLAHGARYTIFSAAALGEAEAIRQLLRDGADINRRMDRTNHRRTPAHLAIVKKQPQALAALIELGADLNVEDAAGLTPLDQAALMGEEDMASRLIEAGAVITLPAALMLGRTADVERLVRENPNMLHNNRQWARLIVRAGTHAPAPVIERLLQSSERLRAGLSIVNLQDDVDTAVDGTSGYTALHAAAFRGNHDTVALLLRHGASPRIRESKYCGTPAGWGRFAGHQAAVDLILAADVDIFDAIDADRGDRVAEILDRDPGAIDRPFHAYATCEPRDGQWWPRPETTPLEWATKQNKQSAVRALTERGAAERTRDQIERAERVVLFLQAACWDHTVHGKGDHRMHDRAAQRMLAHDAALARESLYTAIVCGEIEEVERLLAVRPESAGQTGGPRAWTPILYLCYTRFTHPQTIEHAIAIARLLLDRGANPNDFYMAGDARYSALSGIAGEGEQDSPRQPYAAALFDLLLERGAEPYDIQILYNTHFSGDMVWWLDLVYRRTIETPRGEAWTDPEWKMFDMGHYGSGARFVLETAVKKRDLPLATWALEHGATPNAAPAQDRRFPKRSLYEEAVLAGLTKMADLFVRYGATATTPALTDDEAFLYACLNQDRDRARALLGAHPEYRQSPAAIFAAAQRDRPDAIALLLELGVPIDIADAHNTRALHHAAAGGGLKAAAFLIERGAEIDPIETSYGGPPIGWAAHGDRTAMVDLLSRYSRNIWTLSFRGYVARVREILRDEPALARQVGENGITPLWWLPDDEDQALEIVELLLAAGADPSLKSKSGSTAADWAQKRGMRRVVARLGGA
jgi:ankyrin repeat protein